MAARPKVITEKAQLDAAKKILVTDRKLDALETEMNGQKEALKGYSTTQFFTDLGAKLNENMEPVSVDADITPDLYGNHEYATDEGLLSINFKVSNLEMKEIQEIPAKEFLSGVFGGEYKTLFKEKNLHEVREDKKDELYGLASKDPQSFNYGLAPVVDPKQKDKLAALAKAHPDLFYVTPADGEAFAKSNPGMVESKTVVVPAPSFIEKAAKIDKVVLKNAQPFLIGFFKRTVSVAVKCGNAVK